MKNQLKRIFLSLALLLAVLTAACAPATESVQSEEPGHVDHFVGTVDGSNAFIGLATKDDRILAYVCDGTLQQAPTIYAWFQGELSGSSFDLTSEEGLHLTGQIESHDVSGTVQFADGSEHAFTAALAEHPSGLYRQEETVDGNQIISGWIVRDGDFRGGNRMVKDGTLGKINEALVNSMNEQALVSDP
jgi:hypothetical protein